MSYTHPSTDNLGSLMKSAGDLYTLAMQNETTWAIVLPNVRHILASVLCGLDHLHSKYLQHCDLKGTDCSIARHYREREGEGGR